MANFLDLSPELRNITYFLALPMGRKYDLRRRRRNGAGGAIPALCQVSRQIRDETIPIWRATNHFFAEFSHYHSLHIMKSVDIKDDLANLRGWHARSGFTMMTDFKWSDDVKTLHRGYTTSYLIEVAMEDGECEVSVLYQHSIRPGLCLMFRDSELRQCVESSAKSIGQALAAICEKKLKWEGTTRCTTCKVYRNIE